MPQFEDFKLPMIVFLQPTPKNKNRINQSANVLSCPPELHVLPGNIRSLNIMLGMIIVIIETLQFWESCLQIAGKRLYHGENMPTCNIYLFM